jgi:hypothetical protein
MGVLKVKSSGAWVDIPTVGPPGPQGSQGPAGTGVPAGGATGQVLTKTSATDYATNWQTPSGGGITDAPSDSKYYVRQNAAWVDSAPVLDDVVEAANLAGFPATGAAGIIYVARDTNRLYRWGTGVNTTWSTTDKAAITLSGGNLTAAATSSTAGVRAASSQTAGKFYFEAALTLFGGGGSGTEIGVATAAATLSGNGLAGQAVLTNAKTVSGAIWIDGSNSGSALGGLSSGNTIGIAVDLTARLIWFRIAPSGNWNGSGTANPATGIGGLSISALSGSLFPFFGATFSGDGATVNFGDSAFSGTVPSGFTGGFPAAAGYVEVSPGVTSVTGTAPVVSSGGTTPAISMAAATSSVNGYLTSADWSTFNGKAPLASPTFTGDPKAPTATAGDNDTSIATTAFVQTAIAPLAPTAETYSRIVNGAMQHSQENGNIGASTSGYYPADQWYSSFSTTGAVSVFRTSSVTPNGSRNRIVLQVTTADTSLTTTENAELGTKIEGNRVADLNWGTASAKQVVLRFGWRAPAGTYSYRFVNGATNRTYIGNFTITAGQTNADTQQVFVIPGDTTGTWATDTSIGMYLTIVIAAGPSLIGVTGWQSGNIYGTPANTNGLANVPNEFHLFDVGLYADPNSTGRAPPWVTPDYASELLACMRYWQTTQLRFYGAITSGSSYQNGNAYLTVLSRASPTLSGVNVSVAGFPATVGSLSYAPSGGGIVVEARTANATTVGTFVTTVTANARM